MTGKNDLTSAHLEIIADHLNEKAYRELVVKDMDSLIAVIDRLNDVSSKGVHADVSQTEAIGTVIRLYTLVGDFLRVLDRAPAGAS